MKSSVTKVHDLEEDGSEVLGFEPFARKGYNNYWHIHICICVYIYMCCQIPNIAMVTYSSNMPQTDIGGCN